MSVMQLYRHFDDSGVLLYVGISITALQRLCDHKQQSHWYNKIATVTIQRFESDEDCRKAEMRAIKTEKPLYNIMHNNRSHGETLTVTGVAGRLSMSRRTFYSMLKDGRFTVAPIPGTWPRRWSVEAVDAWIAGRSA